MSYTLYGYPKCSTCRKAKAFLEASGKSFDYVDITLHPPSRQYLESMLATIGGDIRKLFNTSGQVYRELQLSAKLPTMSAADALALLVKDGKLVKRPFLVKDGKGVTVGFDPTKWAALD